MLVAVTCTVLAACGSGSEPPTNAHPAADTTHLSLLVLGGTAQRGFPGDLLESPIGFQVVDPTGRAVAGQRRLRLHIEPGDGTLSDTSIVTDTDGRAGVTWRLGNNIGIRTLTALVEALATGDEVRVSVEVVSPDRADLVIVRGLTSGDTQFVIREGFFSWTYALQWPDTVLRLMPHAPRSDGPGGIPSWQEVTAFHASHAPATAITPWTDNVDVVILEMKQPVRVPITVWVTHDFDETSARAVYDLANLNLAWSSEKTGLQVGTVRIENAPDMSGLGSCSDQPLRADPDAMNIYYVNRQIEDGRPAYQCSPSRVMMGMNTVWSYSPIYRTLLAHEIGHAMALGHVSDTTNVMNGSPVLGGHFTAGQIYRMHFDSYGTLPSVLHLNTAAARNCLSWVSQCPDVGFDNW